MLREFIPLVLRNGFHWKISLTVLWNLFFFRKFNSCCRFDFMLSPKWRSRTPAPAISHICNIFNFCFKAFSKCWDVKDGSSTRSGGCSSVPPDYCYQPSHIFCRKLLLPSFQNINSIVFFLPLMSTAIVLSWYLIYKKCEIMEYFFLVPILGMKIRRAMLS